MAILTRNVTGADVLAIRKTVSDEGPISEDALIEVYFPGDASDPDTADQRKPIEDAIEFLRETGQIDESEDGYELTPTAAEFDDARLALLHGIRTASGEDRAYNEVLEHLAGQDAALVDRDGELLDDMNDRDPSLNWNEMKLRYWARVMEELGVTKSVNGNEYTTVFGPDQDLTLRMLAEATEDEMAPLANVLRELDERYLPVLTDSLDVAPYMERTLLSLSERGDIRLSTVSDIGRSIDIGGTGYSAIEVMTNE